MRQPPFLSLRNAFLPVAFAAMALAQGAQAQSLKQLYEAARTYDAAYLSALAQADSVQHKVAQAQAANRPAVGVSGTGSYSQTDTDRTSTGDTRTIGAAISGRYPLFNKVNDVTIEQSKKTLDAVQSDVDMAEQDLIIRLSQAYFDVLAAQDSAATARASKAAISEQLASAKRNFEVGTATITDTREAQARFDLSTAQELAAENDLLTKRIALDQLVGKTGVAPRPLALPVSIPAVMPAQVDSWVTAADGGHPAIRKQRLALDVAALEVNKARANKLPTVDGVGSVRATNANGKAAAVPGWTKSATVGVELNYSLYNGDLTNNRIKETLVLEDKARKDLDQARRTVAQNTRVAYFGVQSITGQLKALEAAESSSKLALEATQLGYKVGVRVNLDVLNAQSQLFQTQRDVAKGRYDLLLGNLKLRLASGQLRAQDLDPINALLAP
jgi:outer membrane protein